MSHFQESHSPSETFTRIRLIIKIVARAVSLMCHIHIPYLDKKKKVLHTELADTSNIKRNWTSLIMSSPNNFGPEFLFVDSFWKSPQSPCSRSKLVSLSLR